MTSQSSYKWDFQYFQPDRLTGTHNSSVSQSTRSGSWIQWRPLTDSVLSSHVRFELIRVDVVQEGSVDAVLSLADLNS